MFVLGSYDHFPLSVSPSFFSQLCDHVVIKTDWCSQNERMVQRIYWQRWRSSFSFFKSREWRDCWDEHQKQEPTENDEEGLAIEKEDYTSSTSTSSSVSTSSSRYDETKHNMWNPLLELLRHVQIGMRMETFVDEVATARVALSCHFALDLLCDKSDSCWFHQKRLLRKLSLSDTFVPAQTFSVDELFGTRLVLHWWEESHTQTIGLCCQAVQEGSVDRRHAHHSLRLLRENHFISCLTMPIMGNSEGCSTLCWRLAATSCKRFPHMKRCWFFWWIFWVGHRTRQSQRANPNLGKTFKVN